MKYSTDSETLNLDLDDFKAWLESFDPNSIVGMSDDANHCPIAKYLNAKRGGLWEIEYRGGSLTTKGEVTFFDLPPEIKSFVAAVDAGEGYRYPVGAGQARDCLEKVLAQANTKTL